MGLFYWLSAFLLTGLAAVTFAQITSPPSDKTAIVGDDVKLRCTKAGTDWFEWQEFVTDFFGTSIFKAPPDTQPENPKYGIEGTYDLIVKNVILHDGGRYGCSLFREGIWYTANLIVLGEPYIMIPDLTEGMPTYVQCNAFYGGPFLTFIEEEHKPNLRLFIDGEAQSSTVELIPGNPGPPYKESELRMGFNYTPGITDDQRNVTCEIYTQQPASSRKSWTVLGIRYPVRNIDISPRKVSMFIGETLNCSAEGNPKPTYRWSAINSPGPHIVNHQILTINENMVGANEWQCTATNYVHNTQTATTTVEFEVLDEQLPGVNGSVVDGPISPMLVLLSIIAHITVIIIQL